MVVLIDYALRGSDMIDGSQRSEAEQAAHEMLRDLIGGDYSDTTLRVATDHLLSFHRQAREGANLARQDRSYGI